MVTKLTLEIEPTFDMSQDVYENLPLTQLEDHFDEITSSAYSVSLFTDWQSESFNQVWLKRRVTDESGWSGASTFFGATSGAHPSSPNYDHVCGKLHRADGHLWPLV